MSSAQSALYMLPHLILTVMDKVGTTLIPILQINKKRHREIRREEGVVDMACPEKGNIQALDILDITEQNIELSN